jgi:DNA-binding response OmpR family regulator
MARKILIAEDQPNNSQLLESILIRSHPHGVVVFTARDGAEAYEIALREHPDLILLDGTIPGMDGFEVCERLKSRSDTSGSYIIMMSAEFQPEHHAQAALLGADEYIVKPYDIELVIGRIEAVLGLSPP